MLLLLFCILYDLTFLRTGELKGQKGKVASKQKVNENDSMASKKDDILSEAEHTALFPIEKRVMQGTAGFMKRIHSVHILLLNIIYNTKVAEETILRIQAVIKR